MGRRGPSGRPNHLKALEGVQEDRINREEPIPAVGAVICPVDLPDDARAVWERLAPDLIAKKVLTAWDVDTFAVFCRSTAMYNRAATQAEADELMVGGYKGNPVINPAIRIMATCADLMRTSGQRFGLTPGDRASLRVNDDGGSRQDAGRLIV